MKNRLLTYFEEFTKLEEVFVAKEFEMGNEQAVFDSPLQYCRSLITDHQKTTKDNEWEENSDAYEG